MYLYFYNLLYYNNNNRITTKNNANTKRHTNRINKTRPRELKAEFDTYKETHP